MYNICNLTSHVQRSIAVTSGVILKELEALFNFDYQVDPHFDRFNDVLCGYYYRNCSTLPIEFFATILVHFHWYEHLRATGTWESHAVTAFISLKFFLKQQIVLSIEMLSNWNAIQLKWRKWKTVDFLYAK